MRGQSCPRLRHVFRYLLFDLSIFGELTKVVKDLCSVTVDLKPLRPFARKLGRRGYYYEVEYDLGVIFGPELVFRLIHDGRVMGSAVAKYA